MSQTKAEGESGKKHGDALESASEVSNTEDQQGVIPPAEDGGHAKSAAAHLESGVHPNTKPAGNLRQGSHPEALREPPTVVQKAGKQHRD